MQSFSLVKYRLRGEAESFWNQGAISREQGGRPGTLLTLSLPAALLLEALPGLSQRPETPLLTGAPHSPVVSPQPPGGVERMRYRGPGLPKLPKATGANGRVLPSPSRQSCWQKRVCHFSL